MIDTYLKFKMTMELIGIVILGLIFLGLIFLFTISKVLEFIDKKGRNGHKKDK